MVLLLANDFNDSEDLKKYLTNKGFKITANQEFLSQGCENWEKSEEAKGDEYKHQKIVTSVLISQKLDFPIKFETKYLDNKTGSLLRVSHSYQLKSFNENGCLKLSDFEIHNGYSEVKTVKYEPFDSHSDRNPQGKKERIF